MGVRVRRQMRSLSLSLPLPHDFLYLQSFLPHSHHRHIASSLWKFASPFLPSSWPPCLSRSLFSSLLSSVASRESRPHSAPPSSSFPVTFVRWFDLSKQSRTNGRTADGRATLLRPSSLHLRGGVASFVRSGLDGYRYPPSIVRPALPRPALPRRSLPRSLAPLSSSSVATCGRRRFVCHVQSTGISFLQVIPPFWWAREMPHSRSVAASRSSALARLEQTLRRRESGGDAFIVCRPYNARRRPRKCNNT